ncbi:MAG: hypothetical protein ACYC7E_20980 [Armatimonadota bacterium]
MSPAHAGYTVDIAEVVKKAVPWPAAPAAIPHIETVNKATYLKTVADHVAGVLQGTKSQLAAKTVYPNLSVHMGNANWMAIVYRQTGDEGYADLAVQCLKLAYRLQVEPQTDKRRTGPGIDTVRDLYFINRWLDKSPAYTPEARGWVKAIVMKACPSFDNSMGWGHEYGAHNRTAGAAVQAEAVLAMYPDVAQAAKWREYADTIWNMWWAMRDTEESSEHYNGVWFRYLLDWIEIRGVEKQFWSDPGVKRMMERYLYQSFPMGAFPHYSDSCGWNVSWGHYLYFFEACATQYQDGRYKWAAHRIYDYGMNRIEKLTSWAYTGEEALWSMMKAALLVDDAVQEKPREHDIALLQRHKVVQNTRPVAEATKRWFVHYPNEMMSDKLVFHSGSDRDALSLFVEAANQTGHSHNRQPAVLALADHQSVLLMSLGYLERDAEDHNLTQLVDYDAYPYDNTDYHLGNPNNRQQAATALDLGPIGYGLVRVGQFHGYPAVHEREIVFVKSGAVLLKDTVTLAEALKLRWGSLYRVRNIGPDYGDNWANTYLGDWIPLRGLGPNATVPTRWRNSPRDLLIYYLPDKAGKLEVVDESPTDKTIPLPYRIQYTLRQPVQPNVPVATTTLLLPHPPGPAAPLARMVKAYLNEPTRTAVEFVDANTGAAHLVVLNRSGAPLNVFTPRGEVKTDAQLAYLQWAAGKLTGVAMNGGKTLTLAGKELAPQAKPGRANIVPAL